MLSTVALAARPAGNVHAMVQIRQSNCVRCHCFQKFLGRLASVAVRHDEAVVCLPTRQQSPLEGVAFSAAHMVGH